MSVMPERKLPSLDMDEQSKPFWEAAKEGHFLIKSCQACAKAHWYPRKHCPFCGSADTVWIQASGLGTIYTYSVMRRAKPPYAVAYVTLKEGPTVMSNLVEVDFDQLAIGQSVKVLFRESEGGVSIPVFTRTTEPAETAHAQQNR
jgi:uncharacterized OB-fold protein